MATNLLNPSVEAVHDRVRKLFADEFVPSANGSDVSSLPLFDHPVSGHRFRYIPAGKYRMGFAETEERSAKSISDPIQANLQEMRPTRLIEMAPFLVSERPVLFNETEHDPGNTKPTSAAYLTFEDACAHCGALGFELPTEQQWEYFCRAGSQSLFTWGNTLPSDEALAEWLKFDFADDLGRANAWGLYGLFVGEWCSDFFSETYDQANQAHAPGDPHVVRGGGAFFWPWQGDEWVWCMSVMRMPSTGLIDHVCGFRMVRNFPGENF